jgi:hypothetical protein
LDALSRLGDPERISMTLPLLALELAGAQPYTRGGTPWVVSAENARADTHPVPCNMTLQAVRQRWSEIAADVHVTSRVSAYIGLADAYSHCSDVGSATQILDKIDANEVMQARASMQLIRSWIRARNTDRALAVAALQPNPEAQVRSYTEIAAADAIEGHQADALNVLAKAFQVLSDGKIKTSSIMIDRQADLIDGMRQAGDASQARTRTEELARLAERPDAFQPFSLIRVAVRFNDLNLPDRALRVLEKALSALPSGDRVVGFGSVSGPIRYEKSGLGADVLQNAAVEFYRAGNRAKAAELARQVGPLHRRRAAIEIVRHQSAKSRIDPEALAQGLGSENPAELLLVAAARKIEDQNIPAALEFFQRFDKAALPRDPVLRTYLDQNYVRVSALLGKPEYLIAALKHGLRDAHRIGDPDLRTFHLSSMAAFANAAAR